MKTKSTLLLLAIALCFSVHTKEACAQSRKGFEVGIGPSLLVATGDDDTETGFGAHLTLGFGIGEKFTLGVNGAAGIIDDKDADDGTITASVGGIFGRYYFGENAKLTRAFVTFGGGQGSLSGEYTGTEVEVSGPSGMIGLGVDHMRAGSSMGFYGEVNYNFVKFEEVRVGGITLDGFDVDLNYIVVAVGLRFRIQ